MWEKGAHVQDCPPPTLSLSGLHQSTLASLGVIHLHWHWAHLWIFVSSSEWLGEIATLGIIAPQLFVAISISYCMVFTMALSICVLPLSMHVWCLCWSVCWRCHHQLSCLRFYWTYWLTLPPVPYEALLIRNEKAYFDLWHSPFVMILQSAAVIIIRQY